MLKQQGGPLAAKAAEGARPTSPSFGECGTSWTTEYSVDVQSNTRKEIRRPNRLWRCLVYTTIDPRSSTMLAYWDAATTCSLIFTAIVTPVEVAFLTPPPQELRWENTLFLINRAVDCIFIIDMLIQLRMAYQVDTWRAVDPASYQGRKALPQFVLVLGGRSVDLDVRHRPRRGG